MSRRERDERNALYGTNPHSLPGLGHAPGIIPQPVTPNLPRQKNVTPAPVPAPAPLIIPPPPDPSVGRRLDSLEQRAVSAEQSQRSLLDELLRLQQEYKVTVKKHDVEIQEARGHIVQLTTSLRGLQTTNQSLEDRLRRLESSVKESQTQLAQLVNHAQNVERAVTSSQADNNNRKDQQIAKLQELKMEITQAAQGRESNERMLGNLAREIRELQNRVDGVQHEVREVSTSQRLEARYVDAFAKGSVATPPPQSEIAKRTLEDKVVMLQQEVFEMQGRIKSETAARIEAERAVIQRLSEVGSELMESRRRRDEELRAAEQRLRELANMTDNEKQRLLQQLNDLTSDFNKIIDSRESQIREDFIDKVNSLEKKINTDIKQLKQEVEEELVQNLNHRIDQQKMRTEESVSAVKRLQEHDREELQSRIQELQRSLDALVKMQNDHRVTTEQHVSDEITARQKGDAALKKSVDELADRLRLAMATLQVELGPEGGRNKPAAPITPPPPAPKSDPELRSKFDELREHLTIKIADLQHEIDSLETQVTKHGKEIRDLQAKAATVPVPQTDPTLLPRIEAVEFSQERLRRQMTALNDSSSVASVQRDVDTIRNDVGKLRTDLQSTTTAVNARIDREKAARESATSALRQDVTALQSRIA